MYKINFTHIDGTRQSWIATKQNLGHAMAFAKALSVNGSIVLIIE
jgi:hypothetical protein